MNLNLDTTEFVKIGDVQVPDVYNRRFKSGNELVDDLFGGNGFLPGSTFSICGGPGSGKSTFLMQVLELIASNQDKKVGYISGEENIYQIAYNCRRLGLEKISVANITDLDKIKEQVLRHKFDIVIIDSFPTITMKGNFNKRQKEEIIVNSLCSLAKDNEIVIGFILHVTKSGSYKGSTLLPHSTDMNMSIERDDDNDPSIRSFHVSKNRFGCCAYISLQMTGNGFNLAKKATSTELVSLTDKKELTMKEVIGVMGTYYKAVKFLKDNNYQEKKSGKKKVYVRS